jgi:hypothetical protein
MAAELILWPMVFLAIASLWLYIPMSKARVETVKSGKVKAGVYKLNEGEPEESRLYNNAIANQFESPVLFYAVCLAIYVTGLAGWPMIILAWAYGFAKLVHIWFHVSANNLRHRRPAFIVSYALLIALWVAFAIQLVLF